MALFSFALDQQRRNFIDARLREGPYFPDLDIRKWLERQRTALVSVLDWNTWERIIQNQQLSESTDQGELLLCLKSHGREVTGQIPTTTSFGQSVHPHLRSLFGGSAANQRCFLTSRGEVIVLTSDYSLCVSQRGETTQSGPLSAEMILSSIVENLHQGSCDRDLVRAGLINVIEGFIATVEDKADEDFIRTVAVSDLGIRIVQADHVYILTGKGWVLVRPSALRLEKILLSSDFQHLRNRFPLMPICHLVNCPDAFRRYEGRAFYVPLTVEGLTTQLVNQVLLRINDQTSTHFFTTQQFCPAGLIERGQLLVPGQVNVTHFTEQPQT